MLRTSTYYKPRTNALTNTVSWNFKSMMVFKIMDTCIPHVVKEIIGAITVDFIMSQNLQEARSGPAIEID